MGSSDVTEGEMQNMSVLWAPFPTVARADAYTHRLISVLSVT